MKIIGCDFHPSFQQIAMVDTETGEHTERRLMPSEAVQFYSHLHGQVVVGMEASGNTLWFERLLAGLRHQLRLGGASRIRAMEVRKQKTDRRDAALLLNLLLENRFPEIWKPSLEERDTRQLLVHRHKLVGMRRQVKNQLQHLAMNQGLQRKHRLWTRVGRKLLEELPLTRVDGAAARRFAAAAGRSGERHCGAGHRSAPGSQSECCGPTAADASWSGADHQPGLRADAGPDPALPAQPAGG